MAEKSAEQLSRAMSEDADVDANFEAFLAQLRSLRSQRTMPNFGISAAMIKKRIDELVGEGEDGDGGATDSGR